MKKTLIFISSFFIILFISTLKAETINRVDINGNKRVSDETIKIYGGISLKKDYSQKDLDLILKSLYETEFFDDVKIELSNNVLKINLKE